MSINLPKQNSTDSADEVKEFFNQYLTQRISYPSNQVDAVIGYFENRGFEKTSSIAVGTALLQQAKIDNLNVFELLDTLKGFTDVQLSNVVANVLNYNREKISTLGFKIESKFQKTEQRNIII